MYREVEVDLKDPKGMLKFVRDEMARLLDNPHADQRALGEEKLRFYDWLLAREDGAAVFDRYLGEKKHDFDFKRAAKAVGWKG